MAKKYTAEDIKALDGITHVRMRPSMYFEACFKEKTLDPLAFEVLCHALDEYYDGNCSQIEFTFYKNSFRLNYNAGMLLDIVHGMSRAEVIMTKIAACSNMKKHLSVGEEFCKIGMATINAASELCKLKTASNGKTGTFVFEKGETVSKSITDDKADNEFTEIYIKFNDTIFKDFQFTSEGIKEKAAKINSRFKDFEIKIIDKIS